MFRDESSIDLILQDFLKQVLITFFFFAQLATISTSIAVSDSSSSDIFCIEEEVSGQYCALIN